MIFLAINVINLIIFIIYLIIVIVRIYYNLLQHVRIIQNTATEERKEGRKEVKTGRYKKNVESAQDTFFLSPWASD
ncbi:hypothetical protein PUN28_001029 [Cardiocondyla obscurior]|uniref:ATP synthase F0 subunit 8 n=1 Tax=Cardiocondyla obscurior TaxID=286306 RepID=A0AAW2H2H5_9HYME